MTIETYVGLMLKKQILGGRWTVHNWYYFTINFDKYIKQSLKQFVTATRPTSHN